MLIGCESSWYKRTMRGRVNLRLRVRARKVTVLCAPDEQLEAEICSKLIKSIYRSGVIVYKVLLGTDSSVAKVGYHNYPNSLYRGV